MSISKKRIISSIIATIVSSIIATQSCGILSNADYYSYSDDYGSFLYALGKRESDNIYNIENSFKYMGRWQLGLSALEDIGFVNYKGKYTPLANSFGIYDKESFLNSVQGQDYAIYQYHKMTWNYIVNKGLDSYIGSIIQITEPMEVEKTITNEETIINDDGEEEIITTEEVVTTIEDVVIEEIEVTVSNLIAGSHLMGTGNMQKYLEGDTTLTDSTGTPLTEYMRLFSGYHIEDTIVNNAPFEEICNCTGIDVGKYKVKTANPVESGIKVYSGHGIYNNVIGLINNNDTINITQSDGVWGHITLEDGGTGYILLSKLEQFKYISTDTEDTLIVNLFKKQISNSEKPSYTRTTIDFQKDILDTLKIIK